MEPLINRINTISDLIQEGNEGKLNDIFFYYQDKMAEFKHDFCVLAINSDANLKEAVSRLLSNLNIPKNQFARYINSPLSFYNLLIELRDHNKNHNDEIKLLIKIIDNQHKVKWDRLFLLGLVGLLTITCLYPTLADLWQLTAMQEILAGVLSVPVVGIIFTAVVALDSLYKSFKDKKQTFVDKFNDNFFLLVGSVLKFAAYGLILTAAVSTAPITAILLVVSSFVTIIKESFSLLINIKEKSKLGPIPKEIDLTAAQHLIRLKNDMRKHRNSILLNLAEAAVITGIVAVMCFVPGGLFVAIPSVIALILVSIIKKVINKENEKFMRVRLGEKFNVYERRASLATNNLVVVDDLDNRVAIEDLPSPSERSIEISPIQTSHHSKASLFGFFSGSHSKKGKDIQEVELESRASEDIISCGA